MPQQTVRINDRDVPISHILDVYEESIHWMILVYGESAQKVDVATVDKIIDLAPHLVDGNIIKTRKTAHEFHRSFFED